MDGASALVHGARSVLERAVDARSPCVRGNGCARHPRVIRAPHPMQRVQMESGELRGRFIGSSMTAEGSDRESVG
jgi:hypothetical protein